MEITRLLRSNCLCSGGGFHRAIFLGAATESLGRVAGRSGEKPLLVGLVGRLPGGRSLSAGFVFDRSRLASDEPRRWLRLLTYKLASRAPPGKRFRCAVVSVDCAQARRPCHGGLVQRIFPPDGEHPTRSRQIPDGHLAKNGVTSMRRLPQFLAAREKIQATRFVGKCLPKFGGSPPC